MIHTMIDRALICALLPALVMIAPAGAGAVEFDDYRAEAAAASRLLMEDLAAELMHAMQAGGPAAAIDVCARVAPEIAGRLSREHGWKVTRVGTRVRNPLLGMPDAWEQEVFHRFRSQAEAGEPIAGAEHAEIVDEPGGRYFRYMRAIETRQPCLACHGPVDGISAEVMQVLAERYPHDEAQGYLTGELRGAVSIKRRLTD